MMEGLMSNVKDRIKHLYKVLGLTALVSVLPATGASSGGTVRGENKNPHNKEQTMDYVSNNEYSNILNYADIAQENLQEVANCMTSFTMGELREQGYLSYNSFKDYKFTDNDFKKMQCGKMGKAISNYLFKKYRNQVPQGKCLAAVRTAVCGVTGKNILAEPVRGRYLACNWSKGIQNYGEDAPLVFLGEVKLDNNGNDTGEGNINKNDLLYLTGATVMSGGKQLAGHACFNKPIYDKNGKYLRTDARCDGNESLENILENKVGGNGRRYGNSIQAFCMADDKPSPDMAMFLAQNAVRIAYENNMQLIVKDGKIERKSLNLPDNVFKDFANYYAQALDYNSK